MSERPMSSRWSSRPATRIGRWSAGAAIAVTALAGCSGGGSSARTHPGELGRPPGSGRPSSGSGASGRSSSTPGSDPGRPAQPVGAITPDRLRDALLTSFAGLTPITAPQSGSYASLPAAEIAGSTRTTPPGAAITPAGCRSAIWSGPDTGRFGEAAATVVAFREPGDTSPGGVQAWEELVAAAGRPPQAALGTGPVAGCGTVRVSYRGNTLTFAEQRPPSLGRGSRGAVLTPSPENTRRTQLMTFVGDGYVGVVFVQGKVSKDQVDAFASAAYENAARKLG
jgi:hypothetical protein